MPGHIAYRIAAALALGTAFVEVWMNLTQGIAGSTDNPQNQGFFGVVVTGAACAFVARLRPDGMARAMLAAAAVQLFLGAMVATAPMTARLEPMGATGVLSLSAAFTAFWLISAALFHKSAQRAGEGVTA